MKQFLLTPAAGKRLIGKALAAHPAIREALDRHTIVIVAGTTNGYVAEEILSTIGSAADFSRTRFFRGITLPPSLPTTETGRHPDESAFPGDVVIQKGVLVRGRTILDIADELKSGDIIVKGANALDVVRRQAAIYIGHPKAGTIGIALQAVVGRRVHLIMPVGLEKRIPGDLGDIAWRINGPGSSGPRLLPVPGEVVTEIDAVRILTGATSELIAAGGVGGAEGAIWLGVGGTDAQIEATEKVLGSVENEPPLNL